MDDVPVEEHVGRTLSEVLPHLVPAIESVLRRVLETGRAVLSEEVSWSQEDAAGGERYWLLRCYRFFGYNSLVGAVRQRAHLESLAEIGRAVARQAQDFAGGKQQDDVCLLLARKEEAK